MKVHAFYTPAHARLAEEHFLPSAIEHFGRENVDCRLLPDAPEGDYGTPGFVSYAYARLSRYAEICHGAGGPLVLSDVDVRFYGDVPSDLEPYAEGCDRDAWFQWDGPAGYCTGFAYVVDRAAFARLCRVVQVVMRTNPAMEDQQALQLVLARRLTPFSAGLLPACKYWTSGQRGRLWSPGDPLAPPPEILAHHANWTVGVPNKLAMLAEVRRLVGR